MISLEDYLKAKKIVEEYEEQEYTDGMNNAMYCTDCQALHEQECICSEPDEICSECGYTGYHAIKCIYNTNPFDNLLRDGYD